MATLLIVDDEPNVLYSLEKSLRSASLDISTSQTARQAIEMVRRRAPDAVLMDVRLPDMSGLDAFQEMHRVEPRLPVIIITAHGTTDTAIEAMKRGAFDYLLKPFDLQRLREIVSRAVDASRMSRLPADTDAPATQFESSDLIIGRSPAMQDVYKAIGRVAVSNVNVLLLGESGTGKEVVARAIYQHGSRSSKPFVAINCAALPESLLESELFGHERGSFTGADRRRIGKFEQAGGGTIFLDEIGDMSSATQAKVLRVLQDQRFERVGGSETVQTDIRVIAATNQALEELVAAGRFRSDLFYRLNVYTIKLPPLRERIEDVQLLVEYFIRQFNEEVGKSVRFASPETTEILQRYLWPGNVRELQATVKNALVNATTHVLTPDCLPVFVRQGADLAKNLASGPPQDFKLTNLIRTLFQQGEDDIYRKIAFAVDHVLLDEVMRSVNGNQLEASRRLGISRTTLRAKLQVHRLNELASESDDPAHDSLGSQPQ